MNTDQDYNRDCDEIKPKEQMLAVLSLYRTALELSHYKSAWYRFLAWAGHEGARGDQLAIQHAEKLTILFVNSTPDRQQIWKALCEQEPIHSRVKPFLPLVLRPTCTSLPEISPEEKKRRQAAFLFSHHQIQRLLENLAELRTRIENE